MPTTWMVHISRVLTAKKKKNPRAAHDCILRHRDSVTPFIFFTYITHIHACFFLYVIAFTLTSFFDFVITNMAHLEKVPLFCIYAVHFNKCCKTRFLSFSLSPRVSALCISCFIYYILHRYYTNLYVISLRHKKNSWCFSAQEVFFSRVQRTFFADRQLCFGYRTWKMSPVWMNFREVERDTWGIFWGIF